MIKRIFLIVLDSVGAGALPDAEKYFSKGANTLGHILSAQEPKLPNLCHMGLGHIKGLERWQDDTAVGAVGRAAEVSSGKDTTTGHWELAGLRLAQPFPTYPDGFPPEIIKPFESMIATRIIGNCVASGTQIIEQLGEEHLKTGYPIVYTSADSVFQIACHERIWPREKLYHICEQARALLTGKNGVGRVIARPFIGEKKGDFVRTDGRRDFSLEPVGTTVLDALKAEGCDVLGIGKIEDIFCHRGLTQSVHPSGNAGCLSALADALAKDFRGLCFVNLVDFDMLYGHRNDVAGYAGALEAFDQALPDIQAAMLKGDLLIVTADHGCDPTTPSTDHDREYIPLLCWSKAMRGLTKLGTRETYADVAATIAQAFQIPNRFGANSFYPEIDKGE